MFALVVLVIAVGVLEFFTKFIRAPLARDEGKRLLKEDDYRGAEAAFSRAIELWPDCAEFYSSRASARSWLKDYDGAVADAEQAYQLDSHTLFYHTSVSNHHENRAEARFKNGDLDGAIADFTRCRELDPANHSPATSLAVALDKRSHIHFKAGRLEEAAQDSLAAVANNSKDPWILSQGSFALNMRGSKRLKDKQFADAAADFTQALTLEVKRAEAAASSPPADPKLKALSFANPKPDAEQLVRLYHGRGLARIQLGDLTGADEDLTMSLNNDDNFALARVERGLLRLRQGQEAQAQQDFDRYLQTYPERRAGLNASIEEIGAQRK